MKPLTAILALLLAVPPLPASECCCAELARRSAAAHDAAGAVEAPTAGGCPRCAGRKRQQNYPDGISHHCDCEAEFLAIDEGVISPRLVTSEPETNGGRDRFHPARYHPVGTARASAAKHAALFAVALLPLAGVIGPLRAVFVRDDLDCRGTSPAVC